MTTYNTYAAAKTANPESYILVSNVGKFHAVNELPTSHFANGWKLCNPADHCITYNQCEEFKSGMVVMDLSGVMEINYEIAKFLNAHKASGASGAIDSNWDECFILRAAALEEKPKRMRVEYVKAKFNSAWEAAKAFEDGSKLYTKRSHKDFVLIDNAPDVLRFLYDLHERVEVEVSERDEFIELMSEMNKTAKSATLIGFFGELFDSGKFKLVEGE